MNAWEDGTSLSLALDEVGFVCILKRYQRKYYEGFCVAQRNRLNVCIKENAFTIPDNQHMPLNGIPMFDTGCDGISSFTFTVLPDSPCVEQFRRLRTRGDKIVKAILAPTMFHEDEEQFEGFVVSMESCAGWSFASGKRNMDMESQVSSLVKIAFPGAP